MKHNRSIPPATVVPILSYPDVRAAVAWLTEVFGFVERTRIGEDHRAQLSIGCDGAMIVADGGDVPAPSGGRSVAHEIRVRVDDVDAMFERVRAHGVAALEDPTERVYGERDFTVEDIGGHRWQFCETVRDVGPEEFGCETVAPWPAAERP